MNLVSRWNSLILVLLLTTQPGCLLLNAFLPRKPRSVFDTSYLEAAGYSIPPGGMPAPVNLDPNAGPRVVLEVRSEERHLETIPVPEEGLFIQDLVQQAKLHESLGQLSISIMRPQKSGAPLRLDLRTDDSGKATNIGQNYAVLPGDHIIVFHDERTYLERFVDKTIKAKS